MHRDFAWTELHRACTLCQPIPVGHHAQRYRASELLTGALLSAKPDENREIAAAFCALFPCLPFDALVADEHALWHARLRREGKLIGARDLMIAATALVHGLTVVTHNTSEFRRIEGLSLEDWQE